MLDLRIPVKLDRLCMHDNNPPPKELDLMARHALTTTALDSAPTRTTTTCDAPDAYHPGFPCAHVLGRDEPAHRVAGFYSNRTEQFFPYRDVAPAEGETFCELTIAAIGMISNSFGWLPNRAWHV